jgi:serine/threonine protein kinase
MALPFGRYQLLRKIASGGMGQVFLARADGASGFEKLLVIKRVLPHLAEDNEFLQMFLEEARIAARLNHPNLVQIFELGEEGGSSYLAMEYVPGEDLRRLDRLARSKDQRVPLGLACRIIADAAAGLHHAHLATDAHGQPLQLVHRDVSPQNILVGYSGAVKLIDFGVAKAAGRAQMTQSGVLKGKVPYFSPEQAQGKSIDHRSDQFALAIVFWELLTGQRLFKADDDLATLERVRTCNVAAPSTITEVPAELDELVMRALSRQADRRFPDCGALRLAIEEIAIKHALPASNAHLSAFMHSLYAERIAEEASVSRLDELAGEVDLDALPTPNRPGSTSRAPSGRHTVSVRPETTKRPLWPFAAVLGLAVVLSVAGFVVLEPRSHSRPTPVTKPPVTSPPVAQTQTPPPPPNPAPSRVTVTLISEPKGAQVFEGSRNLGAAPLPLELSPEETRSLVLQLSGYEREKIALTARDAPMHEVTLRRVRRVAEPGIKTTR